MVHSCAKCGASISSHEVYYRETPNDSFLQYLHSRAFCKKCYETYGDKLLSWKGEKRNLFSSIEEKDATGGQETSMRNAGRTES